MTAFSLLRLAPCAKTAALSAPLQADSVLPLGFQLQPRGPLPVRWSSRRPPPTAEGCAPACDGGRRYGRCCQGSAERQGHSGGGVNGTPFRALGIRSSTATKRPAAAASAQTRAHGPELAGHFLAVQGPVQYITPLFALRQKTYAGRRAATWAQRSRGWTLPVPPLRGFGFLPVPAHASSFFRCWALVLAGDRFRTGNGTWAPGGRAGPAAAGAQRR